MNILVLQLKRIGDLVLTTPTIAALKAAGHRVTLVTDAPCGSLLPAIEVDETLVYSKKGGNRSLWKRLRQHGWDVCLDFTGSDRSALMCWLSRARRRITFEWVRKKLLRRLAYNEYVDSSVRLKHTADHYLDLTNTLGTTLGSESSTLSLPRAARERAAALVAERGIAGSYVLVHPGSARGEKYWLPERWAEVISRLREIGLSVVLTCGPDGFEKEHASRIETLVNSLAPKGSAPLVLHPPDLLTLAALVEKARLVVSCDTAVVHLAAAFLQPQIVLFGPTNPFHWRPRHARAVVISAAQPERPLKEFQPKMAGQAMEQIPTSTVLSAVEALLSAPR